MNNTVKVNIHWSEWKVRNIESPGRYVAPAKFPQDDLTWPNDSWSVVLEFEKSIEEISDSCPGTARFLLENGPNRRLTRGNTFEMYEGNRLSAKVEIL